MWKDRKDHPNASQDGHYWVYKEGYGTYTCPFYKRYEDAVCGCWMGQEFEYWFDSVMNFTDILNKALESYKPTPFEPERLNPETSKEDAIV